MYRRTVRPVDGLLRGILAVLALGSGSVVRAQEVDTSYGVRVGVGNTDNIRRTDTDKSDETIALAGVNFSLAQDSRRLNADATGDFSYLNYLDDVYDDEVVGSFSGQARLGIVPERFEWRLSDNFGQTSQQAFRPATPENRENINYFTTGPSLVIGAGSATRLTLDGSYSNVGYETSPLDSDRLGGRVGLVRQLSSSASASLNVNYQDVDFKEDALNTDFDTSEAFVRYDVKGSRTSLGVDLGYTQVEQEQQKSSGTLFRLQASRRLSPAATLGLSLGREFSDAGNLFQQLSQLQSTQAGPGGIQPVQSTSDPFTNTYGTLGWYLVRNRTEFGVSVARFEEDYEQDVLRDRTRTTLSASFRRNLTPALEFLASLDRTEEEYGVSSQDFSELYGTMLLSWQLGRHMSIEFQYERVDRGSDSLVDEYVENIGWVRIGYGRGSRRASTTQVPVDVGAYR
jgi:hypothetical protein